MQLKQFCPVCTAQHTKRVESVKRKLIESPQLIEFTISQLPQLKPVTLVSETRFSKSSLVKYSCGHIIALDSIAADKQLGYSSLRKGWRAFEYQVEGIDFIKATNYNCLIADEMGLGKTMQALLALRELIELEMELDESTGVYKAKNGAETGPTIIIVKSSTLYQWINEFEEWTTGNKAGIYPITSSKTFLIAGFGAYIISMDLLPAMVDKLVALKPKLVIADEVQCYKNLKSSRSKALVELIQKGNIKHKIFLSGTPIKNRASEYFLALNLLAPAIFPSFKKFCIQWLEPNDKGGYSRIRPRLLEEFRKLTSKWIIRRECKDVQKDLPPARYNYVDVVIEDEAFKKLYNTELDLFTNWYNDQGSKKDPIALLGWIARLRHTTGMMKASHCAEYVKDFLDSAGDDEPGKPKIAIGIHHHDVKDSLAYALEPYGCLTFSGQDSNEQKALKIKQFNSPDFRVMVINEVSGGTGTDGLQDNCWNVIVLERQWTWADERQFEKRFDRTGQTRSVLFTYMMVHGSVDTILARYVSDKETISKETFGLEYDITQDTNGLREISELVIAGGHI